MHKKLVHREQIEQIKGEMYNGQGGFCLSGGLAWRKGIDKKYLINMPAINGTDNEYVFGKYQIDYCPECKEGYGCSTDVQNFLIHLNDASTAYIRTSRNDFARDGIMTSEGSKNRLNNALTKIKLEEKGEIHQIVGLLHDGDKGYCLSGVLGHTFGVNKDYLKGRSLLQSDERETTYGDADYSGYCPLRGTTIINRYGSGDHKCGMYIENIQALMVHFNDDHKLSFTQANKIIKEMEL